MVAITAEPPERYTRSRTPLRGAFPARDLLIHVFYNARLIRACLVVGLAVGLAAALLSRTEYTAESLLLIRPEAGDAAQQGVVGAAPALALTADAVKRVLQSDIQIMESEPVIRAAVTAVQAERPAPPGRLDRLRNLLVGRERDEAEAAQLSRAMDRFRRDLRVVAEPDSNVIRVSFHSPDRERAIRSVAAVVDAYRNRRASMYVSGSMELQQQSLRQYQSDIQGLERQIAEARAQFRVLDLPQDVATAGARLADIDQRASQAEERLSAVNAETTATRTTLGATPAQVFASREDSNASPNDDTRNTLVRLRQEREHMAAQYTPEWPGLQELDRKIAAAQTQMAANAQDRSQTEIVVRNPVLDTLNGRMASLAIERQALTRQLAELGRQRTEAQARADQLRQADEHLRDLQRTRDVMEGIYRQLSVSQAGTQLQNEVIDDYNNTMRVVQPPTAPLKGRSLAPTFVLAGLLLGVVSAVVASGLATLLRQVFILPGEVERALGAPIIATFDEGGADPDTPDGRMAIEQLATFLYDVQPEGRPLKVVQILSMGDDAASALGMALGRALALTHRQRTLLIDFDREPAFLRKSPASVAIEKRAVAGQDLAVAQTRFQNLWVSLDAAGGPLRGSRTPAARTHRAVEDLRAGFDRVILVSGRDHTGYAARRLYPLTDANIVIVRAEKTRAPAAKQVVETVLESGGDLLGVVFADRRYYVPEAVYRWF